jgi:hypothetical protein
MEQNIVDSSKYKLSLISLDSRFAVQRNGANSEFRIDIPIILKNVIRIRLVSIELPFVEYTFTDSKGNTNFSVTINSTTTTVKIPEGNYTPSVLSETLQAILGTIDKYFTCTINPISSRLTIQNARPFIFSAASSDPTIASRPTHWGLGYFLGFRDPSIKGLLVDGAYECTSYSVITSEPPTYYLIQVRCPDQLVTVTHAGYEGNYIEAFAKIILRGKYDDNSNLLRKEYTFLAPTCVPFFNVKLLDPWGRAVNTLDSDWSLTLEITEIVNSKTYDTLSTTYRR